MNVSHLIQIQAKEQPHKIALLAQKKTLLSFFKIVSPKYESLTFLEFEQRVNHYGQTFLNNGLIPGDKVLVFVRPSLDFPVLIFALFRIGLIPVFIDPGMGVDAMLQCVATSGAKGLIGIPKIHHLKLLKPSHFESIKVSFVIQGRAVNATSFESLVKKGHNPTLSIKEVARTDLAAILFTSGGTGTPKGVMYTHGMFIDQAYKLKQMFRLTMQDKDYPCFPLFGLFSLSLGLTVVMPEVDLMKPALVDAKKISKSLIHHKITFSTGSPALWKRVSQYALRKKVTFPMLRTIATFGAPVDLKLHQDFSKILTHGELFTPYGATECLPVSSITSREIMGETITQTLNGQGTCVGYPAPQVEIQILDLKESKFLPNNEIGEIVVHSSTMTSGYDGLKDATQNIQYFDPISQKKFHRMGDMGRIDKFGRLWFYGRKVHKVNKGNVSILTEEIEPAINYLHEVRRCALLQVHDQVVLVVERMDGVVELPVGLKNKFLNTIKLTLETLPKGQLIDKILIGDNFPVDTRHNIKIDRLLMAQNIVSKL